MKRRGCTAIVFAAVAVCTLSSQGEEVPSIRAVRDKASGIVHPGIMLNALQIKRLREHVANGDEPWATNFAWYISDRVMNRHPRLFYSGWDFHDDPRKDDTMCRDGMTAWYQAQAYIFTGEKVYYDNAWRFLHAYMDGVKSGKPHWDSHFRWGAAMRSMCMAAELVKYVEPPEGSPRWGEEDDKAFIRLMEIGAEWADSRNAWMNQHQFCTAGLMAYAIFRNDGERYREMVERATANSRSGAWGGNGGYGAMARWVTGTNGNRFVEWTEMGRDIGHPFAGFCASLDSIKIMVSQGTKVDTVTGEAVSHASPALHAKNPVHPLAFRDDAFVRGVDYIYKYNLGFDVEWVPFDTKDPKFKLFERISNGGGGRGRTPPGVAYLYNHYRYVRGWKEGLPYFKHIAWIHRFIGREFPDSFLFLPEEISCRDSEAQREKNLHASASLRESQKHFASFLLPEDAGVKRMSDPKEGRFVRLEKHDTVLPLYVRGGRFFGNGDFEIHYRSNGAAGVQVINPADYDTERDDDGRFKAVARFLLPSTDGKWETRRVTLDAVPDRELVKMRVVAKTPPLDLSSVVKSDNRNERKD